MPNLYAIVCCSHVIVVGILKKSINRYANNDDGIVTSLNMYSLNVFDTVSLCSVCRGCLR